MTDSQWLALATLIAANAFIIGFALFGNWWFNERRPTQDVLPPAE